MQNSFKLLLHIISVSLLAGSSAFWGHPGHSHPAPPKPKTAAPSALRVLGLKDSGHTFSAPVGAQFVVSLSSNASTGFSWVVASHNAKVVSVQGEFIAPVAKPPGAPGTQIWRIKMLKPGQTKIVLHYKRPWEKVAPNQIWKAAFKIR